MKALYRLFALEERGSTPGREIRAGVATFLTMSYILFVNPQVLAQAGMPAQDVAIATALASGLACIVMGLLADYPFALAPGMGLNVYFTYGVVEGLGVSWQVALAAVFVEGVIFILLAAGGIRKALLRAIPRDLKLAISSGIGLFLIIIGLKNAGIVVAHPATLVTLGDLSSPSVVITLGALVVTVALLFRNVPGAILLGIVAATAASWMWGLAAPPSRFLSVPNLPKETLLAFDFSGLASGTLLSAVVAFLFVDIFDTAGTLIGVGRRAGFLTPTGELPGADRAFLADAIGTTAGAALGTSTVTTFIESASGVEDGGRTGLTAVTVGVLFVAALFAVPVFASIPPAATAAALILVGILMAEGVRELPWGDLDAVVPSVLTIVAMPFTFSIANGIALGIVSHVAIKTACGRAREIPPLLWLMAILLVAFYAFDPRS